MKLRFARSSLAVSAASLMTATIGTSSLGLVYWTVAARLESPAVVGRAAAALAAMLLLATVAQLNLTNVFVRLLPTAGRLSLRLVTRGYLTVIAMALVAGSVYALSGLSSHVLGGGWEVRVGFVLAVAVLALFALQDAVLTALRLAPWVAIENLAFAVIKLALLPALVLLPLSGAIAVAWLIPAAVAVVGVNFVLLGRVLPRLRATEQGTLPPPRRLLSFVAGEYANSLFTTAAIQLMPLLVAWRLGAAQVAYLTVPWMVLSGINLLMLNVASSFVVEVAGGHADRGDLLLRALRLWGLIVAGVLAVCVLGAQPLMELVGSRYAGHAATLLRLIGASAPFSAVIIVFSTLVWLDQRVWLLAGLQALTAAALLGAALVLLPTLGLVAVGWANLGVQAVGAVIAAPLTVRRIRRGRLAPA